MPHQYWLLIEILVFKGESKKSFEERRKEQNLESNGGNIWERTDWT